MYLYSAHFCSTRKTLRHGSQCYLQLHQCLPLPRKRSPDGASPNWGCAHLIAAYYSFIYPERMKSWLTYSGRCTHISRHSWLVSCRSSAGQRKFAGQRPPFYHCATQPAVSDWVSHESIRCGPQSMYSCEASALNRDKTRSSAIAERPRDASRHWIFR